MSVKQETKTNRWRATIVFLGKEYVIGTFDAREKAQSEYDRVKKAAIKIKEEERIKNYFGIPMNDFTEGAYKKGQAVKQICVSCCGGSIQRVNDCNSLDCEFWKFRPIPEKYIQGEINV